MTDTVTRLPYSVIMVESSNTSRLQPRQACAVESAVRLQRIYLFLLLNYPFKSQAFDLVIIPLGITKNVYYFRQSGLGVVVLMTSSVLDTRDNTTCHLVHLYSYNTLIKYVVKHKSATYAVGKLEVALNMIH